MDRVVETAKALPIPTDQQILHVLNQEFVIDGQAGKIISSAEITVNRGFGKRVWGDG